MTSRLAPILTIAAVGLPVTAIAYTASSYHTLQFNWTSARRTTVTGDWSPGNNKAECGPAEVLSGIDQYYFGWFGNKCCEYGEALQALCRADDAKIFSHHDANTCRNVNFATANNQSGGTWDWDVGAFKGECDYNEYVAGVSQTPQTTPALPAKIESILCCDGGATYEWLEHEADQGCVAVTSRQTPTSSGNWDPSAQAGVNDLECGDGYYPAGLSRVPEGQWHAGMPHALLCCPMPESLIDPCAKNPHLPQCQ